MKKFLNLSEEKNLNDIIFANRNKEYGAYVLRNEEGLVLRKALFIGVSFFITMAAIPLAVNALKADVVETPTVTVPVGPIYIPDEPENPAPVKPEPAAVKPVETFVATVPEPKKVVAKETPAPTMAKYEEAKPGFVETEGNKPVVSYTPPVTAPPANTPPAKPVEQPVDPNAIPTVVDVKADFIGGINAFRNKVGSNMDVSYFEGSGEKITATVSFIVERDGSISGVKANGKDAQFNKEAEKAVRSVRGKWNAAKLKGQAVRSYFNIPITIQFE